MSFDKDFKEIIFLLESDCARFELDVKYIKELLANLKKCYDSNIQTISDDANGTRPEDWKR